MQANDVKVLMRYHAPLSWLDGQPAAVTRKIGNGSFTYVGAWLDQPGARRAVQWMLAESGLEPDVFASPKGVEVYRRAAKDREIFIVDNTSGEAQAITLPAAMKDLITDQTVRSLNLPVYGVAVLVRTR